MILHVICGILQTRQRGMTLRRNNGKQCYEAERGIIWNIRIYRQQMQWTN